ncbi:MAG: glutamate 5-kinase [Phycisphaeraceae bacterium]|nr:glutamate 5-kinase [Phycisphaeraceae bacterium]
MTSGGDREWVDGVRRVVVKVGSRLLVDERHQLDESRIASLVEQIVRVRQGGRQVVLVSSGAIAAGLPDLGLAKRPKDLPSLQAAAALGQARLIEIYRDRFAEHGVAVGQALLTHADLRDRDRHLNARHALNRLLEAGALPIINENDTVAVDEIRVGDNDQLSALVGNLVRADLVVLLTTVGGLYTAPPERGGSLIPRVGAVTAEIRAMAGDSGDGVGTGGMRTKLDAAEICARGGERLVICDGREPDVLSRLLEGEALGTVFEPSAASMAGRKRWIAFFQKPAGSVTIDDGAVAAIRDKGGSLLAIGVRRVEGAFRHGDLVHVRDERGVEVARGLVNYSSSDLEQIAGRRSAEIASLLGACEYDEVIHRDNLALG